MPAIQGPKRWERPASECRQIVDSGIEVATGEVGEPSIGGSNRGLDLAADVPQETLIAGYAIELLASQRPVRVHPQISGVLRLVRKEQDNAFSGHAARVSGKQPGYPP